MIWDKIPHNNSIFELQVFKTVFKSWKVENYEIKKTHTFLDEITQDIFVIDFKSCDSQQKSVKKYDVIYPA